MADIMEDVDFSEEDVEQIVRGAIESTLKEATYTPKKVNDWINSVVDGCLKQLQLLQRPFKYVVTCVIQQKNGCQVPPVAQ